MPSESEAPVQGELFSLSELLSFPEREPAQEQEESDGDRKDS